MALLTYLQIKANGEDAPFLFGEDTTQASVGDTDVSSWLECSSFEVAIETGQQSAQGAGRAASHRVWRPARFVLRLGKSTPWLFESARTNKRIDLTLHFFHSHHETGVVEQNFQYRIRDGRITLIRLIQPNSYDQATSSLDEQVEISVLPSVSEVESMTGGTMMVDDWKSRGA